jgi:hypothetical protein
MSRKLVNEDLVVVRSWPTGCFQVEVMYVPDGEPGTKPRTATVSGKSWSFRDRFANYKAAVKVLEVVGSKEQAEDHAHEFLAMYLADIAEYAWAWEVGQIAAWLSRREPRLPGIGQ